MPTYHVYYKVGGNMFMPDKELRPRNVTHGKNFMLMGIMKGRDPDDIFKRMQAEFIPEKQRVIMNMRCRSAIDGGARGAHTSMSVGDVVYDATNKRWMQCDMAGWKPFGGK
jgi:hypothetical protein